MLKIIPVIDYKPTAASRQTPVFSIKSTQTVIHQAGGSGVNPNNTIPPTKSAGDVTSHTTEAQMWIGNWGHKSHAALRGWFPLYTAMFTCGWLWVNVKIETPLQGQLSNSPHHFHPGLSSQINMHACSRPHLHPWTTIVFTYANDERERRDSRLVCWGEGGYPQWPHAGV